MGRTNRVAALSEDGGRDVAHAQSGDDAAFARIYNELRPKVRNTAYRVIGDEHEAEDTAQDAFLSAYQCLPRLCDPASFEAWLMRITRNRAVDRRRSMLKCRPSERAHDESSDRAPELERVVHRSGVAEPTAESVAVLRAAVSSMPPGMRAVLRSRYVRGRSCEQIAREDGVSVGAVKTRLFRARRLLRAAMTPDRVDPPRRRPAPDLAEKTCVSGLPR